MVFPLPSTILPNGKERLPLSKSIMEAEVILFHLAFKMRLTVLCLGDGKTQKDRFGISEAGPDSGVSHSRRSRVAHGPSCAVTGVGANDLERCRQGDWRWASHSGSAPEEISAPQGECSADTSALGREAAGADEAGGGAGVFGLLETRGRTGPVGRRDALAGGAGAKARAADKALGRVSPAGSPPLAQSGSRHPTSQSPVGRPGGMEKKTLPEELATVLRAEAVRERPVRLMFQDEARFGRMAR